MAKSSTRSSKKSRSTLILERQNYVLLGVSALLIVVGFVAMYVDGQFLGVVSLTVSPILIMSGYALLIYSILRRPDDEQHPADSAEA